MARGNPSDANAIRGAMQKGRWTIEELAAVAELSEKTIQRALDGDSLIDATFHALGKVLDRDPKSLRRNDVEPLLIGTHIHAAFVVVVSLLNDNRIIIPPDKDFGTHLRSGEVKEVNPYELSIDGWEILLEHLIRRGHLYRKYDQTTRIALPTIRDLLEVLDAREAFERHLADQFVKKAEIEQRAIIKSFDNSIEHARELIEDFFRFIEAEAQVHLSWCYENHFLRDTFMSLLKESKFLADRMLAIARANASFNGRQVSLESHRDGFEQMLIELEDIRGTLHVGLKDVTPTHKAIHEHVERVRRIALANEAAVDSWRRSKRKLHLPSEKLEL